MSVLKKVTDFLFGRDPDIFDDKGRVLHKLPKKKWDDWHSRIVQGDEYNWRKHVGVTGNEKPQQTEIQNKS